MQALVTVPNGNFTDPDVRSEIALFARKIISASGSLVNRSSTFLPFTPNEGDMTYWTIDAGNDWKILFSDASNDTFEIVNRYQNNHNNEPSPLNDAVNALAGWMAYKLHGFRSIKVKGSSGSAI